jgi:hypothetical protein
MRRDERAYLNDVIGARETIEQALAGQDLALQVDYNSDEGDIHSAGREDSGR